MSSKARIVGGIVRVDPFPWAGELPDVREAEPLEPISSSEARPTAAPAAQELLPASTAEQEAHLAELERDAFTKGYAQGERAGLEAGAKRTDAMLRRIAQTLEELAELRSTIIRETERELVQLALVLARRVATRELSLDPSLVAAMAHVALERLGESTPAVIKLHPEDFTTIRAERGDQWEGAQVTILPDPGVPRGGCLVESEFGTVDGTLDAQFAEMARSLLGESRPHAAAVAPHDG